MSQGTDNIEDLFRSKLENLEVPVDAKLWTSIESSINRSYQGSSGSSLLSSSVIKGIVISSSAFLLISGVILYYNKDNSSNVRKTASNKNIYTEIKEASFDIDSDSNDLQFNVEEEVALSSSPISSEKAMNVKITALVTTKQEDDSKDYDSIAIIPPTAIKLNENKQIDIIYSTVESKIKESVDVKVEDITVLSAPLLIEKTDVTYLPNIYILSNPEAFKIRYSGEFSDFSISILDSKQNTVYRSEKPDFKWFGDNLYGEKVAPGDYLYLIIGFDKENNKIQKYQSLKVIP